MENRKDYLMCQNHKKIKNMNLLMTTKRILLKRLVNNALFTRSLQPKGIKSTLSDRNAQMESTMYWINIPRLTIAPTYSIYISSKTNRKKMSSRQDLVDAFLGGITPTLKSLNPQLLNEAKWRIFAVVKEAELKQLQLNASIQSQMSTYMTFSSSSSEQSSATPYASPSDGKRNPNEPLYFNLENLWHYYFNISICFFLKSVYY